MVGMQLHNKVAVCVADRVVAWRRVRDPVPAMPPLLSSASPFALPTCSILAVRSCLLSPVAMCAIDIGSTVQPIARPSFLTIPSNSARS